MCFTLNSPKHCGTTTITHLWPFIAFIGLYLSNKHTPERWTYADVYKFGSHARSDPVYTSLKSAWTCVLAWSRREILDHSNTVPVEKDRQMELNLDT